MESEQENNKSSLKKLEVIVVIALVVLGILIYWGWDRFNLSNFSSSDVVNQEEINEALSKSDDVRGVTLEEKLKINEVLSGSGKIRELTPKEQAEIDAVLSN